MAFERAIPEQPPEEKGAPLNRMEMDIGDIRTTAFEGAASVETRRKNGSFEIMIQIGDESETIPMGDMSQDVADRFHEESVGMVERLLPGIDKAAITNLGIIANKIRQDLARRIEQ